LSEFTDSHTGLEPGKYYEGRMIQIVGHNVHFYPKEKDSPAISFRLVHDAFMLHRDTTYHASDSRAEIVAMGPQSHNAWSLYLLVESWLGDGRADRIYVKESLTHREREALAHL
jgi:hypothetical protein